MFEKSPRKYGFSLVEISGSSASAPFPKEEITNLLPMKNRYTAPIIRSVLKAAADEFKIAATPITAANPQTYRPVVIPAETSIALFFDLVAAYRSTSAKSNPGIRTKIPARIAKDK